MDEQSVARGPVRERNPGVLGNVSEPAPEHASGGRLLLERSVAQFK